MKIILAACASHPTLSPSNAKLHDALVALGASVELLVWNRAPVESFVQADLVLTRQTWDYQADPGGFAAWMVRLKDLGGRVEPRPALAVWNNDKRTLVELAAFGVQVPQTVALVAAEATQLDSIATDKLVLKPAFGGDGFGVHLTDRANLAETVAAVQAEVPGRPIMAQEFLPEIKNGEWKLTCVEGQVACALHAVPDGDAFRINSRFKPKSQIAEPPQDAVKVAEKIMAELGTPLCGRVDGVMRGDRFICTELELTDPDLHLHLAPAAATRLAEAALRRAEQRKTES